MRKCHFRKGDIFVVKIGIWWYSTKASNQKTDARFGFGVEKHIKCLFPKKTSKILTKKFEIEPRKALNM